MLLTTYGPKVYCRLNALKFGLPLIIILASDIHIYFEIIYFIEAIEISLRLWIRKVD